MKPEYEYTIEFSPYQGYDKFEYDVILADGTQMNSCYPNAGYFFSIHPDTLEKKVHESKISMIRYTNHPLWCIQKPFEPYPFEDSELWK